MILRRIAILVIGVLMLGGAADCFAAPKAKKKTAPRTQATVATDKKKTEKEIAETRRRLDANARDTRRGLEQLEDLSGRITSQEMQIARIQEDITAVDRRITLLDDSLTAMATRTKTLRTDLAATLRDIRARRTSVNNLTFVFAAPNFSAALRRVGYLKQLNTWRTSKVQALRRQISRVDSVRDTLQALKNSRANMLTSLAATRQSLAQRRVEQQQAVDRLKGEKKQLNALLAKKQQRARELDRELDRIIAAEARRAAAEAEKRRKAEEKRRLEEQKKKEQKAKPKPSQPTPDAKPQPAPPQPEPPKESKPAPQPAGASFADMRGRLPFPVTGSYTIVGNFGRGHHRELSNIEVNNSGIDISAAKGAKVRAVYGGTVSSVFVMPGYDNIVILRHGDYLTVYAGVTALAVRKGQTVKAGATLGSVYTNDEGQSILHFEVRHERAKLNPLEWVR